MKIIDRLEEWIISLMLLGMTSLAFVQVVLRYGFGTGLHWALEMNTVLFAFMIFVGISYCVRIGSHLGVDALVKLMPQAAQRKVGIVAVLLCLVYAGFILFGSYEYVGKMKMVGIEFDDMPIQRWTVLIIMPIGYALMAFRFLQILFNLVTGRTTSLHLADEAADAMKMNAQEGQA